MNNLNIATVSYPTITPSLIPTFSGELNGITQSLVDAYDLYEFLAIDTPFHKWIKRRIESYQFVESLDFIDTDKIVRVETEFFGTKEYSVSNYHLSLDMAKELSMVERNEKGRQARRYFIACERQLLNGTVPSSRNVPSDLIHEALECNKALKQAILDRNDRWELMYRMAKVGMSQRQMALTLQLSESTINREYRKMRELDLLPKNVVGQLCLEV